MNLRASPEKSCASTPTTTTPLPAVLPPRRLQPRRLRLAGAHQEAQKLSTTTLPRSDASESFPVRVEAREVEVRRRRTLPLGELAGRRPCSWCTTFQTSRPSSPATTATDSACRPSFSREGTTNYAGTM